MISELCE